MQEEGTLLRVVRSVSTADTIILDENTIILNEDNIILNESDLEWLALGNVDASSHSTPRKKIKLDETMFFNGSISLNHFLDSERQGRVLKAIYEKNGKFETKDRAKLVQLIIDGLLERHVTVSSSILSGVTCSQLRTNLSILCKYSMARGRLVLGNCYPGTGTKNSTLIKLKRL